MDDNQPTTAREYLHNLRMSEKGLHEQGVLDGSDYDNIIETIFDDKVIVGSKWIKKTWPRDKGLFLVVKELKGDDVAYSDASTNLRYAHISKQELLRDYNYLTQEDIDNM